MATKQVLKSSQEQGVAAWIDYLRVLRLETLLDKLSDQDLLDKYDDVVSTRDNFQYDYNDYVAEVGLEALESNPITSKLFRGGLDYDELIEVHKEMENELNKVRNKAITYGGN